MNYPFKPNPYHPNFGASTSPTSDPQLRRVAEQNARDYHSWLGERSGPQYVQSVIRKVYPPEDAIDSLPSDGIGALLQSRAIAGQHGQQAPLVAQQERHAEDDMRRIETRINNFVRVDCFRQRNGDVLDGLDRVMERINRRLALEKMRGFEAYAAWEGQRNQERKAQIAAFEQALGVGSSSSAAQEDLGNQANVPAGSFEGDGVESDTTMQDTPQRGSGPPTDQRPQRDVASPSLRGMKRQSSEGQSTAAQKQRKKNHPKP